MKDNITLKKAEDMCVLEGNKLIYYIDNNFPTKDIEYQKALYDKWVTIVRYKQKIKNSF